MKKILILGVVALSLGLTGCAVSNPDLSDPTATTGGLKADYVDIPNTDTQVLCIVWDNGDGSQMQCDFTSLHSKG